MLFYPVAVLYEVKAMSKAVGPPTVDVETLSVIERHWVCEPGLSIVDVAGAYKPSKFQLTDSPASKFRVRRLLAVVLVSSLAGAGLPAWLRMNWLALP